MRRNDAASTSFRRRVPTGFLINQCQIITFLILKYDIIENSRIELRGIVLPVQVGGLLGGQRVCCPPSQIIGGGAGPPGPPSSYVYDLSLLAMKSTHSFALEYFVSAYIISVRNRQPCHHANETQPLRFV